VKSLLGKKEKIKEEEPQGGGGQEKKNLTYPTLRCHSPEGHYHNQDEVLKWAKNQNFGIHFSQGKKFLTKATQKGGKKKGLVLWFGARVRSNSSSLGSSQ